MTVTELLGRISSHELAEWKAYFILENERIKEEDRKAKANAKQR